MTVSQTGLHRAAGAAPAVRNLVFISDPKLPLPVDIKRYTYARANVISHIGFDAATTGELPGMELLPSLPTIVVASGKALNIALAYSNRINAEMLLILAPRPLEEGSEVAFDASYAPLAKTVLIAGIGSISEIQVASTLAAKDQNLNVFAFNGTGRSLAETVLAQTIDVLPVGSSAVLEFLLANGRPLPPNLSKYLSDNREKLDKGTFRSGDLDLLGELNQAIPDWPLGLFFLATAHADAQNLERATAFLKQAIELDPNLGRARMKLAQLLYRNGHKEECLAELQYFYGRQKASFGVAELAFRCNVDLGRLATAIGIAEDALDVLPLKQEQVIKFREMIAVSAERLRERYMHDPLWSNDDTLLVQTGRSLAQLELILEAPRAALEHIAGLSLDVSGYRRIVERDLNIDVRGAGHVDVYVKSFRPRSTILVEVPPHSTGSKVFVGENFHGDVKIRLSGANCVVYFGDDCNLKGLELYLNQSDCRVFIGNKVTCQPGNNWAVGGSAGSRIPMLIVGDDAMFSYEVAILTTDGHPVYRCDTGNHVNGSISDVIEPHAWVGYRAVIQKNVTVGACSIVSAASTVTKSVPRFSIAQGTPASCKDASATYWARNEAPDAIDDAKRIYDKYRPFPSPRE